ncbi:hypothetical protein MTBGP_06940 [Moorella thermoacetica]|uniref:MvdC/MvdD family ATP grasp protein n=1 Tax=Neomoorella thermoacetica TaxID=1525 RepID=UPI0030CB5701
MILILTNTDDLTVDYVILRLKELSIPYFRFNVDQFPTFYKIHRSFSNTKKGSIESPYKIVRLEDISVIWYRRLLLPPKVEFFGQENAPYIQHESRHFLEGTFLSLSVPWINPMGNVYIAERKLLQLQIAQECGLVIPKTCITNSPDKLRQFAKNIDVVCKPIYSGLQITPSANYSSYTREITPGELLEQDAEICLCPTLLQERIHKSKDIRITFFGEKAFVVSITGECEQPIDWRRPGIALKYKLTNVPEKIITSCKEMMRRLGLLYAAFDFVTGPSGEYFFLEVNPTGEWAWLDYTLGLNLRDELIQLLLKAGSNGATL